MRGQGRWEREAEEPNADVDWVELANFQELGKRRGDETVVPRVFAIRVKSSSNDAEWLIHDPRDFLVKTLGGQVPALKLGERTRVKTFIVNHHNTLSGRHLYVTASTTDDETVSLTLVKVAR